MIANTDIDMSEPKEKEYAPLIEQKEKEKLAKQNVRNRVR